MNKAGDKNSFYASLLFVIWPFLATALAFLNFRKSWAKNIFWAFCAFYGFTFAIGSESQGSDIVSYVAEFQQLYGIEVSFLDYMDENERADFVRHFIAIVLSRFTDSQPVLTLVYGMIFGFFFSRNMWYIMERLRGKLLPVTIILLVCFFLVNPIWRINGFRMWTATHIFLYGLLPYLCEGKTRNIWVAASSILVHFSFIVPVGVLVSYIVMGNRLTIYYGFFISTFFISEIDMETFNQIAENYLPEVMQDRSESYRREGRVEEFRVDDGRSDRQWYANWYRPALGWTLMGFLSILFFRGRYFFKENREWLNLFSFVLLFFGVANLFSSIPSGHRFLILAYLCALTLIILYLQNQTQDKLMQWYIYVSFPAILLFIVVSIRTALYSLSVTSILGNPIIALFTAGNDFSLNDLMRMIL